MAIIRGFYWYTIFNTFVSWSPLRSKPQIRSFTFPRNAHRRVSCRVYVRYVGTQDDSLNFARSQHSCKFRFSLRSGHIISDFSESGRRLRHWWKRSEVSITVTKDAQSDPTPHSIFFSCLTIDTVIYVFFYFPCSVFTLCCEIFPTAVRGQYIAVVASFWMVGSIYTGMMRMYLKAYDNGLPSSFSSSDIICTVFQL